MTATKILSALVLFFILQDNYAQTDLEFTAFLESQIKRKPKDTILYTNRIDSLTVEMLKKAVDRRKFNHKIRILPTLKLNKTERKYLKNSLDKYSKPSWTDNLLVNSKMITIDDVMPVVGVKQKPERQIFTFTRLIPLRDNTIWLMYFRMLCGKTCGHEELSFYKKEGDTWHQYMIVSQGAW